MYRLVCVDHGQERLLLETSAPLTLIGRAPNAALRLVEDGVADRHAVIERRKDGYHICDLGSPAGVRINHQPVAEHRLVSGDEVELASVRFRFQVVYTAKKGRAFDGLQVIAALAVGAIIVGEIVLVSRMFAQPRSATMRKETSKTVRLPTSTDAANAVGSQGANIAATTAAVPASVSAPPAVLNRMLRVVNVNRLDATNSVSLRFQVRSQVGERVLDTSAIAISVQWLTRAGSAAPIWHAPVTLAIPAGWENFSAKTFTVRWDGTPAELQGGVIRTYYRDKLQDVTAQPATLLPGQ